MAILKLRRHQSELEHIVRLGRLEPFLQQKVLAYVVPGGGKSLLPKIVHDAHPNHKIGWFAPRLALCDQAAQSMMEHGIRLMQTTGEINPSKNETGFVATHDALSRYPELWEQEFKRHPYIFVIDELHHAKRDRYGNAQALAAALSKIRSYSIRLDMTGTIDTNDNTFIDGIEYVEVNGGRGGLEPQWDSDQTANYRVRYDRAAALSEGAIVPIEFHHGDGELAFIDAEGEKTVILSEATKKQESAVVWTALTTEFASNLLETGLAHWNRVGDKLLVVVDSQVSARKYHAILGSKGIDTALAITDNESAQADIKRFRRDARCRAIVTCAMAYEGLDVPPITHVICLTHIRSVPWIEQMLARAWRAAPGKSMCWAFVPSDPKMLRVIEKIRAEQASIVRIMETNTAPGSGESIVPVSGTLQEMQAMLLDGGMASSTMSEDILAELNKRLKELPTNHRVFPDVAAQIHEIIKTLKSAVSEQPSLTTPSEERDNLRRQIATCARQKDSEAGVGFGMTQAFLKKSMRRGIDDLSNDQLKRAARVLAGVTADEIRSFAARGQHGQRHNA